MSELYLVLTDSEGTVLASTDVDVDSLRATVRSSTEAWAVLHDLDLERVLRDRD